MTSLRKKMEADLRLRNLSVGTARQYILKVAAFARHFGRSPASLGEPEVRAWLLHLDARGLSSSSRVVAYAALKFLYVHTLGRPEVMATVPRPRSPRPPLGTPLMREEVAALLEVAKGDPRAYTLTATLLDTGLRLSELCALQVGDIDAKARLIRVRCGKGGKARVVGLGRRHLRLLRRYWVVLRPPGPWVFPSQRLLYPGKVDLDNRWTDRPIGRTSVQRILARLATDAGLRRSVGPHDMRRTFGAWLHSAGTDLRVIQVLLGHASPETTARYTRVHPDLLRAAPSPFEMLV